MFNLFTRALLVCYFNYEKVEDHVQRRMIKFTLNIRDVRNKREREIICVIFNLCIKSSHSMYTRIVYPRLN